MYIRSGSNFFITYTFFTFLFIFFSYSFLLAVPSFFYAAIELTFGLFVCCYVLVIVFVLLIKPVTILIILPVLFFGRGGGWEGVVRKNHRTAEKSQSVRGFEARSAVGVGWGGVGGVFRVQNTTLNHT